MSKKITITVSATVPDDYDIPEYEIQNIENSVRAILPGRDAEVVAGVEDLGVDPVQCEDFLTCPNCGQESDDFLIVDPKKHNGWGNRQCGECAWVFGK